MSIHILKARLDSESARCAVNAEDGNGLVYGSNWGCYKKRKSCSLQIRLTRDSPMVHALADAARVASIHIVKAEFNVESVRRSHTWHMSAVDVWVDSEPLGGLQYV